jgi:hypothetical protein
MLTRKEAAMDWNAGTDWLMRIIMLLFALADRAERAAGRSRFVRRHVLATLHPAEAAAYGIITDTARHYGAPIPIEANVAYSGWIASAADAGDDPDDALRVADRLRALALALSYIAAWADYFARRLTAPRHTPWRGWQYAHARLTGERGTVFAQMACEIPSATGPP